VRGAMEAPAPHASASGAGVTGGSSDA